ncbi:MAG: sialidase family protein [Methylocella sp.]
MQMVSGSKKFRDIHNYDFTLATQYSTDGGTSWHDSADLQLLAGYPLLTDPAMDWDDQGNVFLVGLAGSNPPKFDTLGIVVYKSSDGGKTWGSPNLIHTDSADDKQWAAADSGDPASPYPGRVYAVWDGPGGLLFARTKDHGTTWVGAGAGASPPISAIATGAFADINVADNGDIYIVFLAVNQISMIVSKNGGDSFQATAAPATNITPLGPPLQVVHNFPVFPGGTFRVITLPSASVFGQTVTVAWADFRDGVSRIYYALSTDGGASWGATVPSGRPLLTGPIPNNFQHFHPQMAIDPNGIIGCAFYEFGPKPTTPLIDVIVAQSLDGGASFDPFVVTDQPWDPAVDAPWSHHEDDNTPPDPSLTFIGEYFGFDADERGFYSLWTDTRTGIQELWTAFVPVKRVTFQLHRDHYGQDEIDAARLQPGGPVIKTAFWVAVDGFTARELGITGPGSFALGPTVSFSPSTGLVNSIAPTSLDSTDPSFSPDTLARFRFGYDINFGPDDSAFTSFSGQTETVTLTATAFQGITPSQAQVTFMKQPDPYILQGPQTWWLSNDIRLVQVAQHDSAFGVTMGTDPFDFLQKVTAALEAGNGTAGGQTFDVNTTEDNEVISVAPQTKRGGNLVNVYNFAIARVHYQAATQPASDVRVFFRLFAANSTATDFHSDTTYSRDPATYPVPPANFGQHTTPTPGVIAGEYVSIPCFGAVRQDPTQAGAPNSLPQLQFDTPNDRKLPKTGGPIKDFYYGCYLDINGTDGANSMLPQTPPAGNANGPWPPSSGAALEPLRQAFIRNDHQCLVAEIAFDPDPINPGTQPWNSDKLAQRNISWSYAANPGVDVSRGAIETFEMRPTPKGSAGDTPDEIMIDWLNVPAGQHAEMYMPAVSADAVLARASQLYPTHRLSRVDASTIGCLTGGVTYIPLPEGSGDGANFAALMQISLPAGIRRGQLYQVVVRQLTNAFGEAAAPPPQLTAAGAHPSVVVPALLRWRKVLGTFQINIPVTTKELLLEREELRLSIFRWIAEEISHSSRWWPVFLRYLELIAIRVSELGGDPTQIKPSPNGYGGLPSPGPRPEGPHRLHEYTGKVEALVYDHFGDFDGFVLELHDGETRRFESREGEIEDLVREAWDERIVTTVVVEAEHRHRPLSILLKRSSGWRSR